MILQGRYVTLRPLTVEDAATTLRWRQSKQARLLNLGARTLEEQRQWIESRPRSELDFIIQLKTGWPVGTFSLLLRDEDGNRCAEAGRLLIGEPAIVKRYGAAVAAEAQKLLYQLAFDVYALPRVYCLIPVINTKALEWNRFIGYVEELRFADFYQIDGKPQEAVLLGLYEAAYRAITVPRCDLLIGMTGGSK